jgi:hypothetical protein
LLCLDLDELSCLGLQLLERTSRIHDVMCSNPTRLQLIKKADIHVGIVFCCVVLLRVSDCIIFMPGLMV